MAKRNTNAAGDEPAASPAAPASEPPATPPADAQATRGPPAEEAAPPAAPTVPVPVDWSIDMLIEHRAALADHDIAQIGLRVAGPARGRRRAGRAFGQQPLTVPLAELGGDDLRAIDADPALSWSVVTVDQAED